MPDLGRHEIVREAGLCQIVFTFERRIRVQFSRLLYAKMPQIGLVGR